MLTPIYIALQLAVSCMLVIITFRRTRVSSSSIIGNIAFFLIDFIRHLPYYVLECFICVKLPYDQLVAKN